ncbi:MAG: hypothetical protein WBA29_11440 [Xanthobacteraceae bacterium]
MKTVVPAQAGTHTPQRFGSSNRGEIIQDRQRQGLWVLAYARTTPGLVDPPCSILGGEMMEQHL